VPARQAVQITLPTVSAYVPAEHSMHVLDSGAPVALEYRPLMHCTHCAMAVAASDGK